MSTWKIMRWFYRRLPARILVRTLAFWGRLADHQLNHYSAINIAKVGYQELPITSQNTAHLDHDNRRVLILIPRFFDFDGNNMFYGGAERYLIQLVRVIRELGYEPEVYQCANSAWVRYYSDVRVMGIDTGGNMKRLNEQFLALIPEGMLTIYLAFYLATPRSHTRSIGISHGIDWDHAIFQIIPFVHKRKLEEIFTALSNLGQVISVDTNTINWVRSVRFSLAEKFSYIPNFVDLEQFRPAKRNDAGQHTQEIIILYPRRLHEARGFWLVVDILPEFVEKYHQVKFHFVGKAGPIESAAVQKLMERYPGRVHWYFLPPERMHEAYQQADITIIPTMHSEGTSLSCLEALASGNAVVATNVGGLPDLILPGYNGLLIEPQASALREALEQLVQDESLRLRLGSQGRQVAPVFSLERWRAQWKRVLRKYLVEPSSPVDYHRAKVAVFPAAPGISWEPIKQRPHHLALQLARQGIETFWCDPTGRKPSPQDRLHIIAADDDLYIKEPILFIYYPYHFASVGKFEEFGRAFVIYDVLDDIGIHDQSDALMETPTDVTARDYHLKLLERADLIITSSRVLHERMKAQRSDVLYVPNGVDLEHFARDKVFPTSALARFGSPLIGYHGAIAEWFDHDLLLGVVRQRSQYRFVLVGPVAQQKRLKELIRQPNVHYLGNQPYEQIPGYVAAFDVGILPFVLNTVTEGVRPLKVLEYLAMGKPVVATPLPELVNWPGVLRAHTPEEFAASLDQALETRSALKRDPQMAAFVTASAWPEVVQPLLHALEHLC
jgi:glycosyltransferase involved in cell wall biosynthesis